MDFQKLLGSDSSGSFHGVSDSLDVTNWISKIRSKVEEEVEREYKGFKTISSANHSAFYYEPGQADYGVPSSALELRENELRSKLDQYVRKSVSSPKMKNEIKAIGNSNKYSSSLYDSSFLKQESKDAPESTPISIYPSSTSSDFFSSSSLSKTSSLGKYNQEEVKATPQRRQSITPQRRQSITPKEKTPPKPKTSVRPGTSGSTKRQSIGVKTEKPAPFDLGLEIQVKQVSPPKVKSQSRPVTPSSTKAKRPSSSSISARSATPQSDARKAASKYAPETPSFVPQVKAISPPYRTMLNENRAIVERMRLEEERRRNEDLRKEIEYKQREEDILKEREKLKLELEGMKEKSRKEELEKRKQYELKEKQRKEEEERQKKEREEKRLMADELKKKELQRKKEAQKMAAVAIFETKRRLRVLRKYYNSWHKLIEVSRIKVNKVTAVLRWKKLNKAWHLWRDFVKRSKADKEAKAIQINLQREQRLESESMRWYTTKVLSKFFLQWYALSRVIREKRELEKQHSIRRMKMEAYLQKVAADAQAAQTIPGAVETNTPRKSSKPASATSTPRKVEKKPDPPTPLQIAGTKAVEPLKPLTPRKMSLQPLEKIVPPLAINKTEPTKVPPPVEKLLDEIEEDIEVFEDDFESEEETSEEKPVTQDVDKEAERKRLEEEAKKFKELQENMNKRAEERREKRRALEEKAKKLQEEKKKQQEEEELKKAEELKALQKAQIKQRQQEREKLEQKRLDIKKEKEEAERNTVMAENHYRLALKKYYGLLPWRKLIQAKQENIEKATLFHNRSIMKQILARWRNNVSDIQLEKVLLAQKLYEKILLRQGMKAFLMNYKTVQVVNIRAKNHYEKHTLHAHFSLWKANVKAIIQEKNSRAKQLASKHLLKRFFEEWKRFHQDNKQLQDKEDRKQEIRSKVQGWLAEFRSQKQAQKSSSLL